LDACALIAWIKKEPGEDTVCVLLDRAKDGKDSLYMNIVNLLEVCYGFYRELGAEKTSLIRQKIAALPITIVHDIGGDIFENAVRLKGSCRFSLADSIGLATAIKFSAHFVTSDHHELGEIERNEPIPFLWLPPKPHHQ
jgi:predicted nucleic acid-binding protein